MPALQNIPVRVRTKTRALYKLAPDFIVIEYIRNPLIVTASVTIVDGERFNLRFRSESEAMILESPAGTSLASWGPSEDRHGFEPDVIVGRCKTLEGGFVGDFLMQAPRRIEHATHAGRKNEMRGGAVADLRGPFYIRSHPALAVETNPVGSIAMH